MTRYYKKAYNDEYYIFDSNIISEKDFDEKYEIEGYKAFRNSLTSDKIINKLNEYSQFDNIQYGDIISLETANEIIKNQRKIIKNLKLLKKGGLLNDCEE